MEKIVDPLSETSESRRRSLKVESTFGPKGPDAESGLRARKWNFSLKMESCFEEWSRIHVRVLDFMTTVECFERH